MKKFLSLMACAAMLLSFSSCSDDPESTPAPNPSLTKLATPVLTEGTKTATSFVVNWAAVTNATSYTYSVNAAAEQTTTATTLSMTGLTAGTYTIRVKATGDAAKYTNSDYATLAITLVADEPSTGALVEGYYAIPFVMGDEADTQGETVIKVTRVGTTGNAYTVENLLDFAEPICAAVYDPAKNTFTLTGKAKLPDPESGNMVDVDYFGGFYYYYNKEQTQVCSVCSFPNPDDKEADGTDPWVLKVNATTHELSSVEGLLNLMVASLKGDKIDEILGYGAQIKAGVTISKTTAPAAAVARVATRQGMPSFSAMQFSSTSHFAKMAR
ncbi:MAG: hypothetical protein RR330_05160 [Alistipes sp.]